MRSNKKVFMLLITIFLVALLAGICFAAETPKRLQGENRYETAVEISKEGWPETSEFVVLASGENFPDALCAGPLASMFDAPILLTGKNTLDPRTKAELQRLKAENVFIIGGTGVIAKAVENQLQDMGLSIERIAGQDRYETSVKIAEYICDWTMAQVGDAYVVSGADFADAVSVSPIALSSFSPIILACPTNVPAFDEYIKGSVGAIAGTAYIVGDSSTVRDSVANLFPNAVRITGTDKYERNAAIINYFADRIDFSKPYIATGEAYPDALAGSAFIASRFQGKTSPIILVGRTLSPATKKLIKDKLTSGSEITALGGPGAVSESTLNSVVNLINGIEDEDSSFEKFPQFETVDFEGKKVNNSIFAQHKLTLINYWTPTCAASRQELSELQEISKRYASQDVSVIGTVLQSEKNEAIHEMNNAEANFKNIIMSNSMYDFYVNKIRAVPCTVYVNSNGEIVGRIETGVRAASDLQRTIDNLLGGKASSSPGTNQREQPTGTIGSALSIQEIRAKWNEYKPVFSGSPYIEEPSIVAPHKAGKLAPGLIQDGVSMANFVRYLAGLPDDVVADEALNNQAQHGAVLNAVLGQLNHLPPKPAGMSESFYNIGYKSTSSSNLSFASKSIWSEDDISLIPGDLVSLAASVRNYMKDNSFYNIQTLGHRRWILNPEIKKIGFGFAHRIDEQYGWLFLERFSAMQVFDASRTETVNYDYIKWPNSGNFPVEFFAGEDPWSLSLNPAKYMAPQLAQVKVELQRKSDGKVWVFDKSDNQVGDGQDYFNVNNDGYGVRYCLIFRPGDVGSYKNGDVFDVKITGLKDISGKSVEIKYSVQFFNLE